MISRWDISKTFQVSAKVTIECEHEVLCDLSNGVISCDLEWPITRFSRSRYFSKTNFFKPAHFLLSNCR